MAWFWVMSCFVSLSFKSHESVHSFRLKSSHPKGSAGAAAKWCLSRNKHLKAEPLIAQTAKAGFAKPLFTWQL